MSIYSELGTMVVLALQQDWPGVEQIAKRIRIGIDENGAPIPKALAMEASITKPRADRQKQVAGFVMRAFGVKNMGRKERAARLLEEALEVAQVEGMTVAEVAKLGNHVYAKPPGTAAQEAGGVSIGLLAYCEAIGESADAVEVAELERIYSKPVEHFRARHQAKVDAGVAT